MPVKFLIRACSLLGSFTDATSVLARISRQIIPSGVGNRAFVTSAEMIKSDFNNSRRHGKLDSMPNTVNGHAFTDIDMNVEMDPRNLERFFAIDFDADQYAPSHVDFDDETCQEKIRFHVELGEYQRLKSLAGIGGAIAEETFEHKFETKNCIVGLAAARDVVCASYEKFLHAQIVRDYKQWIASCRNIIEAKEWGKGVQRQYGGFTVHYSHAYLAEGYTKNDVNRFTFVVGLYDQFQHALENDLHLRMPHAQHRIQQHNYDLEAYKKELVTMWVMINYAHESEIAQQLDDKYLVTRYEDDGSQEYKLFQEKLEIFTGEAHLAIPLQFRPPVTDIVGDREMLHKAKRIWLSHKLQDKLIANLATFGIRP